MKQPGTTPEQFTTIRRYVMTDILPRWEINAQRMNVPNERRVDIGVTLDLTDITVRPVTEESGVEEIVRIRRRLSIEEARTLRDDLGAAIKHAESGWTPAKLALEVDRLVAAGTVIEVADRYGNPGWGLPAQEGKEIFQAWKSAGDVVSWAARS